MGWEPSFRLKRALREVDAGRNLVSMGTLDEAVAWSRRVYESALKKQKI
jgi:hypothetical protein